MDILVRKFKDVEVLENFSVKLKLIIYFISNQNKNFLEFLTNCEQPGSIF